MLKSFNLVPTYSPVTAIFNTSQKQNTLPKLTENTLQLSIQNDSIINQKHLSH